MTFTHLKKLLDNNIYQTNLVESVISAVNKALITRLPLLLDGPPGCGKTMGVYYVASQRNADVVEVNASDDLRLKDRENWFKTKVVEKHENERIVLIDELEARSNLEFLTKMIHLNKRTAMSTNTVIIATTNNAWKLGRKKHRISKKDKKKYSIIDIFGAYVSNIKKPDARKMGPHVRRLLGKKKLEVKIPKDLRYLEKIAFDKDEHYEKGHEFYSSFEYFRSYMEASIKDRPIYPPTPVQLGGRIEKWLIVNAFDEANLQSFVKKNQSDFYHIMDTISAADMYRDQRLLSFLPSFKMYFNSYKHPSTILRESKTKSQ